ncbi:MAG: hypothetical protein C0469_11405 [Cyanobacteria bacterium DS2.3.42]|nr:hypothetical protein [Cyanobacteria bacterium DS2.3.42]
MSTEHTARKVTAATFLGIVAFFLCARSVGAETMLSLYQRQRAMGDIEVEIAKDCAKITQKDGNCFVISGPSFDIHVFNPLRKKIARLTYKNFMRNGPKHIEYLEGATEWPLVVEKKSVVYKGLNARLYALPFKHKNGTLVDLKRGKAGSYYVETEFKIDPHIHNFLLQMFHLQPVDGIPLKYVKIGVPFIFGQGLAYNRQEGLVTMLDTITAKRKPFEKSIFAIPKGYKTTHESDVTMGDKTEDMREIIEQLD